MIAIEHSPNAMAVWYAARLAITRSRVWIQPVAAVYQRQLSMPSQQGQLMSSSLRGMMWRPSAADWVGIYLTQFMWTQPCLWHELMMKMAIWCCVAVQYRQMKLLQITMAHTWRLEFCFKVCLVLHYRCICQRSTRPTNTTPTLHNDNIVSYTSVTVHQYVWGHELLIDRKQLYQSTKY